MPKLLLFVPCEKAILAQDNSVSLINILETFTVTLPEEVKSKLPAPLKAPMNWVVVVLWERVPGDESKSYEQILRFVLPDGQIAFEGVERFEMSQRFMRNIAAIEGVPAGQAGDCRLSLSLREISAQDRLEPIADFPLIVVHQ